MLVEVVTGADGQATEHLPEYWVPTPKEALVDEVLGAWVVVFDVGGFDVVFDAGCVEVAVVGGGACVTGGAANVAGGFAGGSAGVLPQAARPRQAIAPQVKAARRLVMLVSLRLGRPK